MTDTAGQLLTKVREVLARRFPRCRECADSDGTCPQSGLPCDLDKAFAALASPTPDAGEAPGQKDAAEAALAYAIWDSENSTRMQAECINEHLERARPIIHWLKVHGYEIVATHDAGEAHDDEADAIRLHREKMIFFDALLEIKCGENLTGCECIEIATRALDKQPAPSASAERARAEQIIDRWTGETLKRGFASSWHYGELIDALRSLSTSPWRTMETAPKDGTEILLLGSFGRRVAYWEETKITGWVKGWFVPCQAPSGSYEPDPQGWMPLPAPPVPAQKET